MRDFGNEVGLSSLGIKISFINIDSVFYLLFWSRVWVLILCNMFVEEVGFGNWK